MLFVWTGLTVLAHANPDRRTGLRWSWAKAFLYSQAMRLSFLAGASLAAFLLATPLAHADRVDHYIKTQMQQRRIPGLALKIVQHGKVVKTAAYGRANLELDVPTRPETVFEIGSVTKQFTAAGILLLAQEGKLSADDKITQHLKDTPHAWTTSRFATS